MVLVSIFCREQAVGNLYNWLLEIVLCISDITKHFSTASTIAFDIRGPGF